MKRMFRDASSFNQPLNPPPAGGWEVSNVGDMDDMFMNASSFNQDISNWNTSSNVSDDDMYIGSAMANNSSYKAPYTS